MADFDEKLKHTTKKAKVVAKKAKKAVVKGGVKVVGACKKGWAKLRKSIKEFKDKNKNKKTDYLGRDHH